MLYLTITATCLLTAPPNRFGDAVRAKGGTPPIVEVAGNEADALESRESFVDAILIIHLDEIDINHVVNCVNEDSAQTQGYG